MFRKSSCSVLRIGKSASLLLGAWLFLCACGYKTTESAPPLYFPFFAERAGSEMEAGFTIVEKSSYDFSLRFTCKNGDEADCARVRRLMGDPGTDRQGRIIDAGVPIFLRLRIYQIVGQGVEELIFEKESSELPLYAHGGGKFDKLITWVLLNPGHYRFTIESFKDVPELESTKIEACIFFAHGK